jgi:hypothetical protein
MNVTKKFDAHRKVYDGKNYIEASLPLKSPGSIMRILVGPNAPDKAANMVSELLKSHGYPTEIPVERSSVTL